MGFGALARMQRAGLLSGCQLKSSDFVQAGQQFTCEPCIKATQIRASHPPSSSAAPGVLHRIHMDVMGPMRVSARGGFKYVVTLLDEYSAFSLIELVASKGDAAQFVKRGIAFSEVQTERQCERVRSDRGVEFVNRDMHSWYADKGIQVEPTAPNTPEQNGRAERLNRTLMEKVRKMLRGAHLGDWYWGFALQYANDIRNWTLCSGKAITPHEAIFGEVPDLEACKVFGSVAWVHVPSQLRTKLEDRSRKGIFLGPEPPMGSKSYRVLIDNRDVVTSSVVFGETEPARAPVPAVSPGVQVNAETFLRPVDDVQDAAPQIA